MELFIYFILFKVYYLKYLNSFFFLFLLSLAWNKLRNLGMVREFVFLIFESKKTQQIITKRKYYSILVKVI